MGDLGDYSGPERRKFTRISFSFPVRFKEGMTQYAYSNDISADGINLKFLEKIETGKYLKLKMTLPVEKECLIVNATGEVKWSQYNEVDNIHVVGVHFLDIDPDDRERLSEFIRSVDEKDEKAPAAPVAAPAGFLSPDDISRTLRRPIKVLIVDDEKNVRYILNLRLAMKKIFEIIQAENGKEALQKAGSLRPDIILLDIMLPGVDGYDICRSLKQSDETKEIPIIFLTARNQVKDVIRAIRSGVDDYVTKPYEFDELFCQMIRVLDASKSVKRIVSE